MSHNLDTHVFEELSDSNEALLRELEIVRQERDALAALCQEAAAVLERTANDTLDGRNMAVRLREANTSSLARLKAQWQAEALERCAKGVAACKPGATPRGISIAIKMEAAELRRQFEEE